MISKFSDLQKFHLPSALLFCCIVNVLFELLIYAIETSWHFSQAAEMANLPHFMIKLDNSASSQSLKLKPSGGHGSPSGAEPLLEYLHIAILNAQL